jgi:inorganic pyrophosphatase
MLPRVAGPAFTPARPAQPAFRTVVADAYKTTVAGDPGTASYRLKFSDDSGKSISPWHDIPLSAGDGTYNALFEIPKMTKPKMEVATKEEGNPIAQDEKKGKLRDYHGPIFWNYGMFPQTWEDPNVEDPATKCNGDNDPVDVVEIGSEVMAQGTVAAVKPLGALAMIDEGELDWKIIAVSASDPMAAKMNDIGDVPKEVIDGIREWFRWYKTPDGKPLNSFGFEEKALSKAEAIKVIDETHGAWKKLMAGDCDAGKLWKPSLVAQSSFSSMLPVAFIGALMGSAAVFATLRLRRRAPAAGEETLL